MMRRRFFQAVTAVIVTVCLLVLSGVLYAQGNSDNAFDRVKEVQERHTGALMARAGVVGTAVGLNDHGRHAVLVLLETPGVGGIPQELEGVPVHPVVTGKIYALPKGGKPGGGSTPSPTSRWDRPVPIGVSTGNEGECSAGTIGCRLTRGYALSNNHVFALENSAPTGTAILQPGRYDTKCSTDLNDSIGTLSAFVTIYFDGTDNTVDAAIAEVKKDALGRYMVDNQTPPDGYGTPKSTPVSATLNMSVQKYGRTTRLTTGRIRALNATILVQYDAGVARFVNQIMIGGGSFSAAGDSGSLIVTQADHSPVGLLFAGGSGATFANPIGAVLTAIGNMTIDGQ